jgi:hypothetical protein
MAPKRKQPERAEEDDQNEQIRGNQQQPLLAASLRAAASHRAVRKPFKVRQRWCSTPLLHPLCYLLTKSEPAGNQAAKAFKGVPGQKAQACTRLACTSAL